MKASLNETPPPFLPIDIAMCEIFRAQRRLKRPRIKNVSKRSTFKSNNFIAVAEQR
jgi:hypothetical protein